MRADQRMILTGRMKRIIYSHRTLPDITPAVVGGVVLQSETFDTALEFVRQALVGPIHAAKIGIAAVRRHFQRVNDARFGRIFEIRHVRMPTGFAGAKTTNRFSIFDHIRNNVDFRMTLYKAAATLLDRRVVKFTKAAAEGNQVFVGQLLRPEQKDLMIKQRTVNGFKLV